MASKIISIKKEAYARLAELKGGGKSFSDVILELTGPKMGLDDLAGAWSKETADDARKAVGSFRKKFSKDARDRTHALLGH